MAQPVDQPAAPPPTPTPSPGARRTIAFDPRSLRRAGLVVIGLAILVAAGQFVLEDGGSVLFQVLMAWLVSIAMEPAVAWLARHMRRGLATGLVMVGALLAGVGFFAAFGGILADQLATFALSVPALLDSAAAWLNDTFGVSIDPDTVLEQIQLPEGALASVGGEVASGLLSILAGLVGGVFSLFTIGLFVFYLSADAPRLKRWVARLLPPRRQELFVQVWDLAVQKTGGYVSARIVLAVINASLTAVFLLIIGMPYWLALGLWTGVVAQFVPTVGTYIAIALPALVGFTSAEPLDGVLALAFGVAYQQVENLTIEPRISARAVDVHPAVAFASVLLGASLFGVAGALVAVPVMALLLTLFQLYSRKYELVPGLAETQPPRRRAVRSSKT